MLFRSWMWHPGLWGDLTEHVPGEEGPEEVSGTEPEPEASTVAGLVPADHTYGIEQTEDADSGTEPAKAIPYLSEEEYVVLNRQEEPEVSGQADAARQRAAGEDLRYYQYFDCDAVRRGMRFTAANVRKGKRLLEEGKVSLHDLESGYTDDRMEMICEAQGEGREGRTSFPLQFVFSRDQVLFADCGCPQCNRHYYYGYYRREYCAYLYAFFDLVEKRVKRENLGDATDKLAMVLMQTLMSQRVNGFLPGDGKEVESLTLLPKLIKRQGELAVSFRVGKGKMFVIKDLAEFCENVRQAKTAVYGSSTSINHNSNHFKE